MTATKHGVQILPINAPTVNFEYTPGIGETETREWGGERGDVKAKYESLKNAAQTGGQIEGNLTSLSYRNAAGRSTCMARFERSSTLNSPDGSDTRVVEELYATDIIRDVRAAPYWTTTVATKLTDDEVVAVTAAVDNNLQESEIDGFGGWSASQKELKYHMMHGQQSYFETGFVLRLSEYGVITSQIQASFTGINQVAATAPELSNQMGLLIDSLPIGEWLYKPPQAEHLGKGKWRITREWQYAEKWSKIYGGTWGTT